MKPIVLATDGSPSAAEATLQAVDLARTFGVTLVAVSVEHPNQAGAGYYGYAEVLVELEKAERERVETTLAQTAAIAAEAGIACEPVHARGSVADEICRVAARRNARMIVVGAHGWGPVQRVLHGSVSSAVVHEARCPVLVVPGGPALLAEAPAIDRIAVAP
jgi:nucleotide-binding universal stress UspA family protein